MPRAIGTTIAGLVVAFVMSSAAAQKSRDNHDRRIKIINETSSDLVELYASNIGVKDDWEGDILGVDTLPAGDSVVAEIDDGTGYCLYDFKFVFDDGEVIVRSRVDVCKLETYRLSDGDS